MQQCTSLKRYYFCSSSSTQDWPSQHKNANIGHGKLDWAFPNPDHKWNSKETISCPAWIFLALPARKFQGSELLGLPGMPLLPLRETTCQRETPLNARLPGSSVEVQVWLDGSICVVTWLWNMVARWLPFLPYCNVDTTSCLLQYLEKNSLGQMNSKASLVVFYLSVHSSAFCGLLLIRQKEWESCFHCWCPNQMSKMWSKWCFTLTQCNTQAHIINSLDSLSQIHHKKKLSSCMFSIKIGSIW